MSVLIVTSVGDIVLDLYADRCPLTCKNFLKLCKMKYYNGILFHKVEKDFLAQTGDRTGTGTGGDSIYKFLYGDQARFFDDEIRPDLKHARTGTVAMASAGENLNASQFYFTLRDDLDYLDGKHTVFGIVEEKEGLDTLAKINEAYADVNGRPFKDIRIKHAYILDDPFDDPPQLADLIPDKSPETKPSDEIADERLEDNWVPVDETLGPQELDERIRTKEAHTNAAILESLGDIPDAEIKPPENVLFVCKLNPVTQDEDLYTIFSRFGNVTSADIIRDFKTGDSLCYAFIEFENNEACERAYFKMDNVLIDDRRIHVDFSQSVSRLWNQFRHGKRSTNKEGCFKCGATDHFARDCDKDSDNNQKGQKYVLKDENTQRGGHEHQGYDMLFDEHNLDVANQGNREERENFKKPNADNVKIEHSRERDQDGKKSDRYRHEHNGSRHRREDESYESRHRRDDERNYESRHRREDERSQESRQRREDERRHDSKRHDDHHREKQKDGRRAERDEVEYRKQQDSRKESENEDHNRRSSGRREMDRLDNDKHRSAQADHHKRSREDESYRERRDRDKRR